MSLDFACEDALYEQLNVQITRHEVVGVEEEVLMRKEGSGIDEKLLMKVDLLCRLRARP